MRLARKKPISSATVRQAPWLYTFADLMNLLLCFFIMIVAFSDINVNKFEELSISIANSIGISNNSTPDNEMIGTGMSQLSSLPGYYSKLKDNSGVTSSDQNISKSGNENGTSTDQTQDTKKAEIEKAIAALNEEMETASSTMYDQVSDLTEQYNLTDYVELSMDPDHKYVELTMKGSILYDSGKAEIKKESLPILNSIGKILKVFKGNSIEITGHTDNVPMSGDSQFKDNNWLSSARALNAAQYLIEECGIDPQTLKYSGRGEYEPIASNATEAGRSKNRRIEIKIFNKYSSE